MSEGEPMADSKSNQTLVKHYRIRKEFVWLCVAGVLGSVGYQINDYVAHVNWPPYDGSNLNLIKELDCWSKYPAPSRQELSTWYSSPLDWTIDRRQYLDNPRCAVIPYLRFEGSGVRLSYDILDVEKQKRTARVVITFD